jgi:monoamine oxidase
MHHNQLTQAFKIAFKKALLGEAASAKLLLQRQESRRNFLKNAAILGVGATMIPSFLNAKEVGAKKNIVIVGAGMAGLNAAYQLKKLGLSATVYEASNRVGGRMFTVQNYFGNNLSTDLGGEFVDANQEDLIQLAKELNVPLYDLRTDSFQKEVLFFENQSYGEKELVIALQPFVAQLTKDVVSLPEELIYKNARQLERLDNQSVKEYLTGIGISGWLFNFLDVMLSREYGMEIAEQSSLNFLIMLDKSGGFYGEHEIYKIKGGSQQLTDAIYLKVKDRVKLKHELVAIKEKNGAYELSFSNNKMPVSIAADYVILALPFSILRHIKMEVPMAAEKRKCIDEIGVGNSSKFIMGMNSKPWRSAKKQGYCFTDESFGCGWDSTHMQSDSTASFTVFGGGKSSDKIFMDKPQQLLHEFTPAVTKIYSGANDMFTGKHIKFCWAKQPFAKAGYTSFKKGQYSSIVGWEAVPVGNIYFAGEHVSGQFQGFMNGAAETGRMAAQQIVTKILLVKSNSI